jgi:hypothetical protein
MGQQDFIKNQHSTIMDSKDSEVNSILDKEFKRMIIRMTNKIRGHK